MAERGGLKAAMALAFVCSLVRPAGVSAVSVAQACVEVSCFSGVVAACGSCFPTSAPTFCKSPCQPSWGSLDAITCLGQAGNTYWLNNVQSLNVKCGLPPIPNAAAAAASPLDGGLGAADGLGGTAGTAATGAAVTPQVAPATVAVNTAPAQSLSGGGTPASDTTGVVTPTTVGVGSTVAAPAAVGVGSSVAATAPVSTAAGTAAAGTAAGSTATDTSTAASAAAAGAAASGTNPQATTGGAGTTGTATATAGAVSSAIGSFGCAASAARLDMATASQCVTSITDNNACTAPCAAQFALFAPACRNTMAQDTFYGKTWQGVFTACRVSYSVSGPVVADTAANIAGGPTVATAATSVTATNAGSDPLLAAVSPSADQAAPSSAAAAALPLLSAAAAATALLLL